MSVRPSHPAMGDTPPARARWHPAALPGAVFTLWLALVGASAWWVRTHPDSSPAPTCLFRRATGVECPTCGSTRAVLALGELDVPRALWLNPLVTMLVLASPLLLLAWAWSRGREPGALSRAMRARGGLLWAGVVLLALGINWWWVVSRR